MVKQIIGGVVTVVIGGTTIAISKSDVAKNFSHETGMTPQQAQQYVDNVKGVSWTKVGQSFIDDGNAAVNGLAQIDCANYTYTWESPTLSCTDGKSQLQQIGNDEVVLGNCYQSLDTNLGDSATSKIKECLADIDTVSSDYNYPIAGAILDTATLTDARNTNAYNKSVLEAALTTH